MFPTYVDSSLLTEDVFFIASAESVSHDHDRADLTGLIDHGVRKLVAAGKRRVLGFMQKGLAAPKAERLESPSSPTDDAATPSPSATFDPSPLVFGVFPAVVDLQCHRHDHPYCSSLYASPRTFSNPPLYSEESSVSTYEAPRGFGLGLFGVEAPLSNGSIVTEDELRAEEKKRYAGLPGWFRRSSSNVCLLDVSDDDSAETLERVRRWSSAWGIDLDS